MSDSDVWTRACRMVEPLCDERGYIADAMLGATLAQLLKQFALSERLRAMEEAADEERLARIIYEQDPHYEGGEYVDGFPASPGGNLTWDQACARDAEFSPEYLIPITKFARDTARAIAAALRGSS